MTIDREANRKSYPNVLSLEKVRLILGISKRKAAWMLQNGIIKCENTGKKTRQYRVKLTDLFRYLDMASKTKQQWKSALIVKTTVSAFFISKNKKEKKHEIQEQKPSGSIQRRSPQDEPSGRCENGGALWSFFFTDRWLPPT